MAMALDSGKERSFSMAAMPSTGPMARNAKAGPHPTESEITGTRRMVTMVSRNPRPVWKVRAVPR